MISAEENPSGCWARRATRFAGKREIAGEFRPGRLTGVEGLGWLSDTCQNRRPHRIISRGKERHPSQAYSVEEKRTRTLGGPTIRQKKVGERQGIPFGLSAAVLTRSGRERGGVGPGEKPGGKNLCELGEDAPQMKVSVGQYGRFRTVQTIPQKR